MFSIFSPCAGNALLRRLVRIGVLDEAKMKLDYVLGLRLDDFLERRLQTQVFKLGLAKSIHHARILIRQKHIRSDYECSLNWSSIEVNNLISQFLFANGWQRLFTITGATT